MLVASWRGAGNARSFHKKTAFIVPLSVLNALLIETKPLSQQIQDVGTDVLEYSNQIKSVQKSVKNIRKKSEFFMKLMVMQ